MVFSNVSSLLQQLRYNNFEHNYKSGKFLGNQLQHEKEKSLITAIQDPTDKFTHSPQEINHIFYRYCHNLYLEASNPNQEDIQAFLNNLYIAQLSTEHRNIPDAPLTIYELFRALDKMPLGEAPGSDGFPTEFIINFWSVLAPLFYRTVTEIKSTGHIRVTRECARTIM